MSDTIEAPVLGKVRSRHVKAARGAIHAFLKKHAEENGEISVSRRRLALVVNVEFKKLNRHRGEGLDFEDAEFASRKALAQLVERGELEIIPTPANEHGMKLPSVFKLTGE